MALVTPATTLSRQAAQHCALLPPSLRTPAYLIAHISKLLDPPEFNHLCYDLPYICQFPSSFPLSYVVMLSVC